MQKQCYNWLLWLLKGLSLYVEELYLEVIMDFKSFLIAFVVGMFFMLAFLNFLTIQDVLMTIYDLSNPRSK